MPLTAGIGPTKPTTVILLCGLPGSGKSTMRGKLVSNGWAYVSQDEMATAEACEKKLISALKRRQSCIVDRCNVTPSERRLWLQHATRAVDKGLVKGVELHFEAVWMATCPEVCKERAKARQDHDTLSPENADQVIDSFCRGMRPPERSGQEPYDAVHHVATDNDEELIVKRFADPARVDTSIQLAPPAKALSKSTHSVEAEASHQEERASETAATQAELFILRHGERADRARGTDGGWSDDPPLTKDGREMAKRAGAAVRIIATAPWAPVVYSSPFYRCLQTANEVAAELGAHVRVEPGLSELFSSRVFDRAPALREPAEALSSALQRVELDASEAPVLAAPPRWPEEGCEADARVLCTGRALAARHPGRALCLVCHSHALIALSRSLPTSGGGSVPSRSGYCALSHVALDGQLLRAVDQSYLAKAELGAKVESVAVPDFHAGCWTDGWQWRVSVDALFDLGLEEVLACYPAFSRLFHQGSLDKQQVW
eukprot:CAMPEP_0171129300 /NCGR_PEP_ID=MMETSP0766_2-20121228/118647_1 /TAXON_ID=439317 /ORGANISM="Gambierdiscus australes, Strain CAWD 149" /LENGTH=488 /DNA_ID=CAMNT_0011592495 /DNA_START=40 /DNA_END=1503 /DNA_ORIENTATION=+